MCNDCRWIWTEDELPERNRFVRFRRRIEYEYGEAKIRISADSRYALYINGEYIGQGPVRAWPGHWQYDTYDIQPYLNAGDNVIAVLVNHYGEGDFQYIPAPAGLWAQIELQGNTIVTDSSWKASSDEAYISLAPRISVQECFEERFDARMDDAWLSAEYDDAKWLPAVSNCQNSHDNMSPRDIPYLTMEPVLPQKVISVEAVDSVRYCFTVNLSAYLIPGDIMSNGAACHAYIATQVFAQEDTQASIIFPHGAPGAVKLNGLDVTGDLRLTKGWNNLVIAVSGAFHFLEFAFCIDGPDGLIFSCKGDKDSSPLALAGPFELSSDTAQCIQSIYMTTLTVVSPTDSDSTGEVGEAFLKSGDVASAVDASFFHEIKPEHLPPSSVFVNSYTDHVRDNQINVDNRDCLLSGNGWTTVSPVMDGSDVRILLDFGKEVVGYHKFEVEASAGTIIDFHNFEFIQPDGRYNHAEGMNNSLRYVCRDGRQSYQSFQRRGFRYSYLILRNMSAPVKLKGVQVLFSTYPQTRRGSFDSSDSKLNQIWNVGAHTLRCCAEDTYTDCPTYEQVHWVGDARNEALIDWVINGDPRLWSHCLMQTGQSLDRSPITESHVPSAWENILPAWSFMWMMSCREYMLYTGDTTKSLELLSFVKRNVEGIRSNLNDVGLFEMRAWNMFDWAEMDTPNSGVVTHQNCFAVGALRDGAELADWLGENDLAAEWRAMALQLSDAINEQLWNDEVKAYTDCLRDSEHSPVYSQQTNTVAYMSGVAKGDRADRCREIMHDPPEGFVKAGSPFFEFFLLEAYQNSGITQKFIDTIRKDWGFMVDMGATTFWEMWSVVSPDGRLTRSHCHGWSAAPTFFLSTYALGVKPRGPGFNPVVIEPHPGDLAWCRGVVPTPMGDIEVQWENYDGKPFEIRIKAPKQAEIELVLPRQGTATINGTLVS